MQTYNSASILLQSRHQDLHLCDRGLRLSLLESIRSPRMKPTSIALIGPAYPLRRGGIATYTETLAATYQRLGRRAAIFTFRYQYPHWLFPGKTQWSSEPAPDDLVIYPVIHSLLPPNWLRVAQQLAAWNPDLLLVNVWLPFLAPCLGAIVRLARRFRPTIISVGILHNIMPHERFPLSRPLTRYVLDSLNGFLLLSEAVARDLSLFDRTKPRRVHPHPAFEYGPPIPKDEARRRLGLPLDAPIALFFGLVRPYKGLDLLLEALAQTPVPVFALIAGEWYMDPSPFFRRVHELGLSNRIRVDNRFILQEEAPLYFCAADIVVQPYRSATQSGVTPLAFRYERPVVVTRVGGLAEYVEHGKTGYVVAPHPTALAEALTDFFQHARAHAFTLHLQQAARMWSWESVVETLDGLTAEITARQ